MVRMQVERLPDLNVPRILHTVFCAGGEVVAAGGHTTGFVPTQTNCIRSQRGCSFTQFVNNYRVEYAKQLLHRHPDMKLSEIWTASGFSSESSFFRAFKTVTGTTPKAVAERE